MKQASVWNKTRRCRPTVFGTSSIDKQKSQFLFFSCKGLHEAFEKYLLFIVVAVCGKMIHAMMGRYNSSIFKNKVTAAAVISCRRMSNNVELNEI